MKQWTDEQRQAITANSGTILVSAAAGSGKTSVLVERIVHKLTDENDPVPPSALLVVTFTNAAAAEMRSRIYKRLRELQEEEPHREILYALTARLDEMNVCTMDSFCMKLVRENFNACGVEPDFGMIEEGEEQALKAQIARQITEDLYKSPEGNHEALTRLFQAGRDDNALCEGIQALSDFSMSEDFPDAWLDTVAEHFKPAKAEDSVWGKILLRHFAEGVGYCLSLYETVLEELFEDAALQEKLEALYQTEYDVLSGLLRDVTVGCWDTACESISHARNVIGANRFPVLRGYKDDPLKLRVQAKRDAVKAVLKKLEEDCAATNAENMEDVEALAPAAQQLVDAVKRFNLALFEEKKRKNLYGFSDITHFAVSLLYDPAAQDRKTPLARELAEGLNEIMIDEYQDTNRVQERLFSCLSKNEENMFLVGDVKQSIYRFRLASPELFTEKLEAFPKYDPDAPVKKSKIILSKNFRSRKGVTEAVNFLFSKLMSKTCGEITYDDDEALVFGADKYPESASPDVEVCLIDADEIGAAEAEAQYIASLIERNIAEGSPVSDGERQRSATYGDFCILLRSAKNNAEIYANALRKKNIPVFFDSREGFFDTAEVRIMLSFLRAVDNPVSDLDLLAAMLSPLGLFTPQEAAALKSDYAEQRRGRQPLYMAVQYAAENGNVQCCSFLALMERFRMLSATASAPEVINTIYNETPVLSAVRAMDGGKLREANLRALYEAAVKFSAEDEKSLCAFLRYLSVLIDNGADLRKGSAGADYNSVSILTMHRSKGLEFPFVIIGGITKKFNLSERSSVLSVSHALGIGLKRREPEKLKFYDTLSSKAVKTELRSAALSEELRIYYVALTRAKEKLILLLTPSDLDKAIFNAQASLPVIGQLPPYHVASAVSPLQWLLPVLLQHEDLAPFRAIPGGSAPAEFSIAASRVRISPEENTQPPEEPAPVDEALNETIRRSIAQTYPYGAVSGALSLHTASKLREEHFSAQYFGKKVPAFLYDSALSPADIGTATHKFLQYCDFAKQPCDIAAEIERLVSLSLLSGQEGRSVNQEAINRFFGSQLFARIMRAEKVYKEHSFTIAKSVCDFDPALPKRFADEKTVVIGKIDLVFIENGKAVIVDYKTDRIGEIGELPPRYADQLKVYCEAVEQALGYEAAEKILYSLTLCDFIAC